MKSRLRVARRPSVVRTALKFSLIVGPILVVINHGDAILAGTMDTIAWMKCALTMLIPYTVSTLSSINVYLDCENTYE